jgi:hypothetical protein
MLITPLPSAERSVAKPFDGEKIRHICIERMQSG